MKHYKEGLNPDEGYCKSCGHREEYCACNIDY